MDPDDNGSRFDKFFETTLGKILSLCVAVAAGIGTGYGLNATDGLLIAISILLIEALLGYHIVSRRLANLADSLKASTTAVAQSSELTASALARGSALIDSLIRAFRAICRPLNHPCDQLFVDQLNQIDGDSEELTDRAIMLARGKYCTTVDQWSKIALAASQDTVGTSDWRGISDQMTLSVAQQNFAEWWSGQPALRFLDANEKLNHARPGSVRRTFIFDNPHDPPVAFTPVAAEMRRRQLPYRLIASEQTAARKGGPIGFTVIDHHVVAYSDFTAVGSPRLNISRDQKEVQKYRRQADQLWEDAGQPIDEVVDVPPVGPD